MIGQKTNPHLYAIVVGEMSGDTLGAGLMKAILKRDPQARFVGIGGPQMQKMGMVSAYDMNQLSVMGIFEVVKHLFTILKIRRGITKLLLKLKPCVMIGIDSPDFNLTVERKLKKAGIRTIHYVSPSVWAWREGRMKTIQASCDEVLALLPFEKEYYDKVGMPCTYVGHTLASSIPLKVDQKSARERINLYKNSVDAIEGKVLAILPGSRASVVARMLPTYAKTAQIIRNTISDITFVSVAPNREIAVLVKDIWLQTAPDISLTVYVGCNQDVIASSDVCLLTCGTIAFETMLLKRPMVVAYKVSKLTAMIARRMLKVSTFSLPNLLAKRDIVKEFIQEDCNTFNLSRECISLLTSDNTIMKKEFERIHESIRTDSNELAADVVFKQKALIPKEQIEEGNKEDLEQSLNKIAQNSAIKDENSLKSETKDNQNTESVFSDDDVEDKNEAQEEQDLDKDNATTSQNSKKKSKKVDIVEAKKSNSKKSSAKRSRKGKNAAKLKSDKAEPKLDISLSDNTADNSSNHEVKI